MAMKSDPSAEQAPRFCARCSALLRPGTGNFYLVNIEAVADPTPPIVAAEELADDLREKVKHLLAQMEHLSEQEALDQVYRRLTLHLCTPCYQRWIEDPTGGETDAGDRDEERTPMRKLRVDLADLAMAFEDAFLEVSSFLDLETGQVVRITDEIQHEIENLDAETTIDEEDAPGTVEAAPQERRLPDWIEEAVRQARQVEDSLGTRYVRIPTADSHEGYRDMEEFIETVPSERLQERLAQAIHGRGAFRRFKDVLAGHPDERQRWFAFKDARLRERVLEWLASQGIEPVAE